MNEAMLQGLSQQGIEQIKAFLRQFKPLLPEKYLGITIDTLVELYESQYGGYSDRSQLRSGMFTAVAEVFGSSCIGNYKDKKESKKHIKYCRIAPNEPGLPVPLLENKYYFEHSGRNQSPPIVRNTCTLMELDFSWQNHACILDCNMVVEDQKDNKTSKEEEMPQNSKQENEFDTNDSKFVNSNIEIQSDSVAFVEIRDKVVDTELSTTNHKSVFPLPIPPLNSKEMYDYSWKQFRTAPQWLQEFHQHPTFANGFDLQGHIPIIMTDLRRKQLNQDGFLVIPNILPIHLLNETKRYILMEQQSENVETDSYKIFSRQRFAPGYVTKQGWNKFGYAGIPQQVITALPNLYVCMAELYNTSRLATNFYEYKFNFGRSEQNGNNLEFFHADCNYAEVLFAEQIGLPVNNLLWQVIVPLTPMNPKTTTVYFAKGFHLYWKDATYRALKAGKWTRRGWKTCNPYNQFLRLDVENLIQKKLTPVSTEVGDIIIFSSLIPHGPNLNATKETRIALYPYFTPHLSLQCVENPTEVMSYFPNSLKSVKSSVQTGACPDYAANPWVNYKLSKVSRNFFPFLPYYQLPLSLLGECLFGFKPWTNFDSMMAKSLFGMENTRTELIKLMEQRIYEAFQIWNHRIVYWLRIHFEHPLLQPIKCVLCLRLENCTLAKWWHSTDAIIHKQLGCACVRCKLTQQFGWKLLNEITNCNRSDCLTQY